MPDPGSSDCAERVERTGFLDNRIYDFTSASLAPVSEEAFVVNGWWPLKATPFTFECFKAWFNLLVVSGLSRMVFTSERIGEASSIVFTITIFFFGTGLSETPQTLAAMPVASDVRRMPSALPGMTFVVVLVNTFLVPNRLAFELKENHKVGMKI